MAFAVILSGCGPGLRRLSARLGASGYIAAMGLPGPWLPLTMKTTALTLNLRGRRDRQPSRILASSGTCPGRTVYPFAVLGFRLLRSSVVRVPTSHRHLLSRALESLPSALGRLTMLRSARKPPPRAAHAVSRAAAVHSVAVHRRCHRFCLGNYRNRRRRIPRAGYPIDELGDGAPDRGNDSSLQFDELWRGLGGCVCLLGPYPPRDPGMARCRSDRWRRRCFFRRPLPVGDMDALHPGPALGSYPA